MNADPSGYPAGFPHLAEPTSEMLSCRGDALYIEGVDVVGMAETTPTPFFLFSATQIDRNIAALRDSFRQFHPATRVFYASKVCSNLWFLDRVRRAGIEIEVNSGGELWKARKAGFEPRQIIFNGVAKTRAEVAAALEGPIEALVVDSVFELRRIADVAADLRKQARVALRVDLNVASETHPGLRTSKGAKAGIDVSEALGAFGLAAQLPNIDLVGMHYHIGSQITRVDPYIEALEAALALLTRIETAHDIRLEHLNIGGGFAIPYYDRTGDEPDTYFEAPHTLEGYAREIGGRVEAARPDLQLYLEPGRAIAGNSAILVSRVEAEKTKLVEATHGRISREDWLMIDTGVFRAKPNSHHQQGVQGQAARHLASPRNDHGIRPRVRGRRDGRHPRLRDLRLS